MVRETVAIETLANAATVRISGLPESAVRLGLRLTQPCYFVFIPARNRENSFEIWRVPLRARNRRMSALMQPEITLTSEPPDDAIRSLGRLIAKFNEVGSGRPNDFQPLALLVSDPGTKEILGGLWAWTSFSVLRIDLLFLPEHLRGSGLGRLLIQQVEDEAVRRGCIAAWLDTFSYQAPGFYQRLGYTVFGVIEDYPPGHSRYFLKKTLATRTAAPPPAESEPPTTKDKA